MLSLLALCGCANLKLSGEHTYTHEDVSHKHKNTKVLTYNGTIQDMPFKVVNKINFDPIHTDKPPYYEASYELWFW